MKLLQELLEALNGSQRAAMNLGRNTGLAGKPIAKQETIEKNMGADAWVPYSEGYKEGKRTFDKNNKGRRGTDKPVTEGADRAAIKLAKVAGKDGKPALSKATVEKSFGPGVYDAYMSAYKEAKADHDSKDDGDAWREKTSAKRQGRHYHE